MHVDVYPSDIKPIPLRQNISGTGSQLTINANKHSHSTILEMQRISLSSLSNAVSRYDITGQSGMNEKIDSRKKNRLV